MDLTTSYLGFRLDHPFIAGASPLGSRLDTVKRLEDAGCAAIVLHSLFEEQVTFANQGRIGHLDPLAPEFKDALAHFPADADYVFNPDGYAEHIVRVKRAVSVPVVASLNGTSAESWLRFGRVIEQAGADALELNLYEVATDDKVPGTLIEDQLLNMTIEMKRALRIPIAIKLSPFFTSLANVARNLDRAGSDGLVLFNRFYQPDVDIRTMQPVTNVELSSSGELLLRLRWLAIFHGRVRPSLAVSGGVATPDDGIKALLAGADAVQMVSAILRHGPGHVKTMLTGLERWMEWQKIESLADVRGRVSLEAVRNPAAFERGGYIRTLQSWKVG